MKRRAFLASLIAALAAFPARAQSYLPFTVPVGTFPLSVHASGRYLVTAGGTPFFVHGDVAWAIVAQLTNAECDQYVDDRAAKGVNLVLLSAPEPAFTSQTPQYNNVDGVAPFGTMSPVDWTDPVEAYWLRVDRVVNRCKANGMVVLFTPAYSAYTGQEAFGWYNQILATSDADLQTYGAFLANRYTQGNVIWNLGGDMDDNATIRNKQWNIVTGLRSVRTTDIITAHHVQPGGGADSYTYWGGGGYPGYSLNWVYGWESLGDYVYELTPLAYTRSIPFLGAEFQYEGEPNPAINAAQLRRQSYGAILGGGCGQIFGNSPIWHFESSRAPYPYSGTWESNLNSTGSVQQQYVKALFTAYEWWKIEPKTDSSLVTTSLGTNASRLYPARASDGSFAMIYTPSVNFTVAMSQLAPSSVRGRWYNPADGTYAAASGSPFANSGTQAFTAPGERVLVLDAA